MVGFLDRDRNGGVHPDEVPQQMREDFDKALAQGDSDGNGELDLAEYWAVAVAQARRQRAASAEEADSAAGE